MGQKILVKINRESIEIDKSVFLLLLNNKMICHLKSFKATLEENKITYSKLKDLCRRCSVPLPLIFAPINIAQIHADDDSHELDKKFNYKQNVSVSSRGTFDKSDISLIIKDISIKQQILNSKVLTRQNNCEYAGLLSKLIAQNSNVSELATNVKNYFEINLEEFRALSYTKGLAYITDKIETKNIFISYSSHEYMPQKLRRELSMSGICIKDKKFPFIFVNTRDGDSSPFILETKGRQLFTLISMIISIGMNKFFVEFHKNKNTTKGTRMINSIAGEFLLPKNDVINETLRNSDDVNRLAKKFNLSKSMIIYRFKELELITEVLAAELYSKLSDKKVSTFKKRTTPINGFGKYNGKRFSKELISALGNGKISKNTFNQVLFRVNKVTEAHHQKYIDTFK